MKENDITEIIVDCAYRIHKEIGPGLLESVYEVILADSIREKSLQVKRQQAIPIRFDGKEFNEGFRVDLVVEDKIIIEIKSMERLIPAHKKQLLTYLRLSGFKVGLIINFGGALLKGNIERLVNNLDELDRAT